MIKSGRLLTGDAPWLGFSPLQNLLSDFLCGSLDVLHFFANAGTGRFIAPVGLGDVFFNFLDESFQCLKFLHGSSLLKQKTLQRGGWGVNSGERGGQSQLDRMSSGMRNCGKLSSSATLKKARAGCPLYQYGTEPL